MVMSDGLQILQVIKREHDTFRLTQKGVVLDLKTGEVYEGVSDGRQEARSQGSEGAGRDAS